MLNVCFTCVIMTQKTVMHVKHPAILIIGKNFDKWLATLVYITRNKYCSVYHMLNFEKCYSKKACICKNNNYFKSRTSHRDFIWIIRVIIINIIDKYKWSIWKYYIFVHFCKNIWCIEHERNINIYRFVYNTVIITEPWKMRQEIISLLLGTYICSPEIECFLISVRILRKATICIKIFYWIIKMENLRIINIKKKKYQINVFWENKGPWNI